MLIKLPTRFAPGDRLEVEDVRRQAVELFRIPLVSQLLEVGPEPVAVLNRYRQIVYANPPFRSIVGVQDSEELLGLRPGEALNCTYARTTEGGCGTTEFCSQCGAALAILAGLSGRRGSQECTILRADGEALELQVWSQPLELEGHPYLFVFVSDRSNEKRRRVLERLFFHDVLNTAGGLYGFADMLRETLPGEDEAAEFAEIILALSRTVIDEIKAQRELAAAESNDLVPNLEEVAGGALLDDVARSYRAHEVARHRHVEVAPDSEDVHLLTDPNLLRRVVGNMVKNALEASEPGQKVTVACRALDGGARFTVHNPAAMPRETQLQVFKRSFSTKGVGRGIGTYSIKLFGETYLKGKVGFTSSPQKGTTFHVWLPLGQEPPPATAGGPGAS